MLTLANAWGQSPPRKAAEWKCFQLHNSILGSRFENSPVRSRPKMCHCNEFRPNGAHKLGAPCEPTVKQDKRRLKEDRGTERNSDSMIAPYGPQAAMRLLRGLCARGSVFDHESCSLD